MATFTEYIYIYIYVYIYLYIYLYLYTLYYFIFYISYILYILYIFYIYIYIGFTDFQYYYLVDSFGKSQWCSRNRFSTVMFKNSARLFPDFRNVEWFVQRWLNCNYDVECISTTLNDLYTIYDTLNDF